MQQPNLIIQPAGSNNPQTERNFRETIINPVSISRIGQVDAKLADSLETVYPSKLVPTWGVKPNNKTKWDNIKVGDAVLFVGDNKVFASATVSVQPIHNPELAIELWGRDRTDGQTWEYIYFVDEVHDRDIPYADLSTFIGRGAKYIYRGFEVLDYEKSEQALQALGLLSDVYQLIPTDQEYVHAVDSIDAAIPLEKKVLREYRTEQQKLRTFLFKGKRESACGICNKKYPIEFLVAAHIKRRELCSPEEKRDIQHIVMPLCRFGCDELFERGYVGVDTATRKVVVVYYDTLTEAAIEYLKGIDGQNCVYVNDKSAKYFDYRNHQMVHVAVLPS